jgi:hypothetical protein
VTLLDSEEPLELDAVEARLIARFSPPLQPDEVHRCISHVAASFHDAPVRVYLPLLIERGATRQLERRVQRLDTGSGPGRDLFATTET